MYECEYSFHRYANLFPMMAGDDFLSLVEDVRRSGLREKIWLFQDQILDGRNRYMACLQADVMPQFRTFTGNEQQALDAVISWNLERRHLDSTQRACVAIELEGLLSELERQAKERQKESGRFAGKDKEGNPILQVPQLIAEPEEPAQPRAERESRAKVAKALNTNRQYVSDAKRIHQTNPELYERAKAGEVSMPLAVQINRLPESAQQDILESVADLPDEQKRKAVRDAVSNASRQVKSEKLQQIAQGNSTLESPEKFAVIYADPPWKYEHVKTDSRAIENHYPTMDLQEICDLPVADICTPEAILFLWATSPKLAESMRVIESWGFNYRTCAVWVKDKLGMGYYFRQQHELLLVATKGEMFAPPTEARVSSVIEGERTKHSAKPPIFAETIEKMYPNLPKVELFCRSPREGWFVWGNQSENTIN